MRALCSSLCTLTLAACSGDPAPLVLANGFPADSPESAGQDLFLHSAWGTEVTDAWPPAEFMLALMDDEPDVFGDQYARFGFLPDPADDFPLGFKRGRTDPEKVHETCALCHVSALPDGRLWAGMPAVRLDFSRFRREVSRRWVAAGNPPLLTPAEEAKALAYGPGRTGADSGEYSRPVPADFPPYFTLSARTHLNYMGTGQNIRTETTFSLYALGAGYPNRAAARVPLPTPEAIEEFLLFFGHMSAPPAPAVDAALVERGRAVFEASRCGSCHHVGDLALDGVVTLDTSSTARERLPGEDPAFPTGSITTSGAHRVLQDGDPDDPSSGEGDSERLADYLLLILENDLAIRRTDGYRVADLRGLAYSAPYLHNGSVPTLEALLSPAAMRPTKWEREGFTIDTTLPGNGNGGHEFGADLPDADKAALIEFLRSLE